MSWNGKYDVKALVLLCFTVAESGAFQNLVTLVILVISVVVGYETDQGSSPATSALNLLALVVFTLECVCKIGAQAVGSNPTLPRALEKYFNDHWNKFDFFVVCIGMSELLPGDASDGPWIVLRLLRMLRLFRLAKSFPRLRSIIEALGDGLSSALWVLVLISILNYLLAVSCSFGQLFISALLWHFLFSYNISSWSISNILLVYPQPLTLLLSPPLFLPSLCTPPLSFLVFVVYSVSTTTPVPWGDALPQERPIPLRFPWRRVFQHLAGGDA
jgi:hypothetical protein